MFQVGDTIKRTYSSGTWKVMKIQYVYKNLSAAYRGILLDASAKESIGRNWTFFNVSDNEIQLYNPSKHKQIKTEFLGGLNEFL